MLLKYTQILLEFEHVNQKSFLFSPYLKLKCLVSQAVEVWLKISSLKHHKDMTIKIQATVEIPTIVFLAYFTYLDITCCKTLN